MTQPSRPPAAPSPAVPAVLLDAHRLAVAEVAAAVAVDPAAGLTEAQADARLALSGSNSLARVERQPVWRMLFEAATEPFVILLAASGILAILVGEARDGLLVLAGLIPIVGADVVTEYRGERALEALRAAAGPASPGPAIPARDRDQRGTGWCRAMSCCCRAATSCPPISAACERSVSSWTGAR